MSENLSIDEIIRRAHEIKAETEKQLEAAEKSLDEKTRAAKLSSEVDEELVTQRAREAFEDIAEEEEDIKEYVPQNKEKVRVFNGSEKTKPEALKTDGKTRSISLNADGKTNAITDLSKLKDKEQNNTDDEKTKPINFVSSSSNENVPNSDLKKIPTIVARDKLYDNFGGDNLEDIEEETGVQIKLEGFDDVIESVPTIDEELAERELEKRRQEKVGKFRLFGPDETDAELGNNSVVKDDYSSKGEKESFLDMLIARKSSITFKLIVTAVIDALLVMLTVFKDSAGMPTFLTSHTAYFVTALALFVIAIGVNLNIFTHGFNFKNGINFDFSVSVVTLLVAAHTLALLISNSLWIDNGVLLPAAAVFGLLMSQLGKQRMMSRIVDNFEFLSDSEEKYTVENIANAVDANIISRGLLEENEPCLKMSVRTDFPTNFLEISCKREPADRISRRIFFISALLSLVLFIVIGIMDNFNTGFNMAVCAMTIAAPCAALFLTNTVLCDISSQLDEYSSRVCGFEGALMASDADAVVMEACDLFGKDSCDLHGIKTFGGAKVDEAIINAAAVIIQTKSPLSHVFDDVIIGQQSILPKVEGIQYEEKLGTSAWIYKRKVLVGTRELLLHHGVSVPKESFENKYTIKGRKALYLAVGGKIVAMFIVSYSANPFLKKELSKLEKSGMTLIVKSSDPYINEQSLTELFEIPEGFIRVMNYSAARIYDKYSGLHVEKSPSYLVHNGTALGLVSAMRGAEITVGTRGLISFLTTFGCVLGFAAIALLAVLGAYSQITALSILLFQIIWIAFTTVATKLKSLGI